MGRVAAVRCGSLLFAAEAIVANERGDRRTPALAVYSHWEVIGHGFSIRWSPSPIPTLARTQFADAAR